MSDKLQDAVKLLREYCGGIPLSNAIIYTINNNIYIMETINKLREENDNCKAQYQHWDKKYSEALIKIREMKEENERLKTERDIHKQHEELLADAYADLEEENKRLKKEANLYRASMYYSLFNKEET